MMSIFSSLKHLITPKNIALAGAAYFGAPYLASALGGGSTASGAAMLGTAGNAINPVVGTTLGGGLTAGKVMLGTTGLNLYQNYQSGKQGAKQAQAYNTQQQTQFDTQQQAQNDYNQQQMAMQQQQFDYQQQMANAAAAEAANRETQMRSSANRINNAFSGNRYGGFRNALVGYNVNVLNDKKTLFDRLQKFAFSRSGLSGSNTQVQAQGVAQKRYNTGLQDIQNYADSRVGALESRDNSLRSSLIAQALGGAQIGPINIPGAGAVSTDPNIGSVYDGLLQQVGQNNPLANFGGLFSGQGYSSVPKKATPGRYTGVIS